MRDLRFPLQFCWGHAMVQLVKALCYKAEGRGFDCRWCHWNFSLIHSSWPHYGPRVDSASNINEYQKYFLGSWRQPMRNVDNFNTFICRLSWNLGSSKLSGPVQACTGIALPFRVILLNFQTFCYIMPCRLTDFSNNFSDSKFRVKRPKKSLVPSFLI